MLKKYIYMYIMFCTEWQVLRDFLLHIGRTSAEKSAITAFLGGVAMCCSVLRCVAICYDVLRDVAVC